MVHHLGQVPVVVEAASVVVSLKPTPKNPEGDGGGGSWVESIGYTNGNSS